MSTLGQKVQIHYLVMDTLKSKNEFLEFVKSLEAQKEFGKVNMSFYFIGKKEFNDSTWNNKKQVIKLFYSKIPCNSNLNQVLIGEDDIINQLNSSTKNTLISTKSTFNEIDLNISFDFQSNSMTSQLSLLEKLKELVKVKTDKDHHLLVIEKNFSFQTPEVLLDPKNVIKKTTGQTINFKTSTPFRTLNLGKGLSIDGPNSLKLSPETNTISILSYTDGLGCISNTDTLKIEIPKDCSCETLKGLFKLDLTKKITMKIEEVESLEYDYRISPRIDGAFVYKIILKSENIMDNDCFDAIQFSFKSNDEKFPMNTIKNRVEKSEMKMNTDGSWEIDIDLSSDIEMIRNAKSFAFLTITPIINENQCIEKVQTLKVKFSRCGIK